MTRALFIVATFTVAFAALADGPGLSLRIADEAAPAGSIVQIKVEVTEPKPISTGRGKIKTRGVATVEGIVLMNEGQDTYGVAMVDGDELTFAITSPSSLFGTPADYPILGIAGRVAPGALNGTSFPLILDPSGLGFRDPSGAVYPTEIADGRLTVVSNAVSIGNVKPGSGVVPAGTVVTISGSNFTPNTRIDLGEADVAQQRFISSNRIDVVLARSAAMHGMRIRARNDDKSFGRSECEYFSYERTSALGASSDPLFSKTVPLFAPATYTSAVIDLPRVTATRKRRAASPARGSGSSNNNARVGLALQNLGPSPATVTVELLDTAGHPYAVNTVPVGPDQHWVRELGEVFGVVSPPAALRIRSNVPVQLLGLAADSSSAIAAALPPH
ncbi:MAG TPA: IPT/TIG domain-containing protein [Thermoanaerobaculia bacterium]|nr:IPT/TIG domain-containing protein [Thermoanaerobaculia bacterium]